MEPKFFNVTYVNTHGITSHATCAMGVVASYLQLLLREGSQIVSVIAV